MNYYFGIIIAIFIHLNVKPKKKKKSVAECFNHMGLDCSCKSLELFFVVSFSFFSSSWQQTTLYKIDNRGNQMRPKGYKVLAVRRTTTMLHIKKPSVGWLSFRNCMITKLHQVLPLNIAYPFKKSSHWVELLFGKSTRSRKIVRIRYWHVFHTLENKALTVLLLAEAAPGTYMAQAMIEAFKRVKAPDPTDVENCQ